MAAKTSEYVGGVPLEVQGYNCFLTNQSELASQEPVGPVPLHLWLHLFAAAVTSPHFALPVITTCNLFQCLLEVVEQLCPRKHQYQKLW